MGSDPLRDFALWDDDREERLSKRPRCSECGNHIQEDYYYSLGNEMYCENCVKKMITYLGE